VTADVERSKVKELLQTVVAMAAHWLAGPLPAFVRKPLEAAVTDAVVGLLKDLVKLTDLHASRFIDVTYHTADKNKPKKTREVWDGAWTDDVYSLAGSFSLDVRRTGSSMEGTLSVSGAPCLSGGALQATVDGDQVQFGLVAGGRDLITFTGVIQGRRGVGTWVTGSECGNGAGAWQAQLTSSSAG
jgi:hypothetical protein